MTRIAILTFSLFASLASACVGSPGNGATTAQQVSTQAVPEQAQGQLAAPNPNLLCPSAGTCEKASALCVDPSNPQDSWCVILQRCFDCEL